MSYGDRGKVPVTKQLSAEEQREQEYLLFVQRHSRLPETIIVEGLIYHRHESYMHDTVDRYFLSYSTVSKHPDKKVFMHYEETNKYLPVLKAWRKLAEHRNEWK